MLITPLFLGGAVSAVIIGAGTVWYGFTRIFKSGKKGK